ncbi:MAG: hypothetical protein AAB263_17775, partial [Planctomycetota bacterium]
MPWNTTNRRAQPTYTGTVRRENRRNKHAARAPFDREAREAAWRPLDPGRDNPEEPQRGSDYGD